MSFVVVIPARYASTRLPGKPLADIHGKPMVQHVVEKALQSGADRVIVATDDERVQQALAPFAAAAGFEVCMTSPDHQSGTERLAEVCRHYGFAADTIIVNVQGDEPLIPPVIIRQVADNLAAASAPMATLSVPIRDAEEAFNPNAVKVVTDREGYVSLSQLAAEHEISVSHLQKIFKRVYGVPVYHYIKEYRLEQAAVELVRSAKPVTQIAQAAGYDNASKFSACFKARYGATPSQYRAHAK